MQTVLFGEDILKACDSRFSDCSPNRDTSSKEALKPVLSHSRIPAEAWSKQIYITKAYE